MKVCCLDSGEHDCGAVELARDGQWATIIADGQVDKSFGGEQASWDFGAVVRNVAESGDPGKAALEGHRTNLNGENITTRGGIITGLKSTAFGNKTTI
jgi:hypothetical protein